MTTFTWTSQTPLLASVDADGVMRALAAGTAILRATAEDGTSAAYPLPTQVATASATANYAGNTEFGDATDGDASDEVIIRRAQYASSFGPARGIPNWVSYDLEATHFGAEDRCDCFTYDPELPQAQRYTTTDYTGAGTAAGYGIDRGHLARFSDREVYIIAGASGSKGTVKNEGRKTIPAVTWKVAVVMPRDAGLTSIDSWQDVQVVAVLMPNDAGARNVAWQTYQVTVDAVEAASGFDVLSALRAGVEVAVESNTQPPRPCSTDRGPRMRVIRPR